MEWAMEVNKKQFSEIFGVSVRTVYVQDPVVPLPASLTAETPQPAITDLLTYGASLDLNVSLLSALGQCNIDKASINKIEAYRLNNRSL
ncbi:TPA: peptidase [Citrobacter freundii]